MNVHFIIDAIITLQQRNGILSHMTATIFTPHNIGALFHSIIQYTEYND